MAGSRVELHPAAIDDARGALGWYSARSRLAGLAFAQELDLAIERIAEAPRRWPAYQENCRRYVFHRFPFSVIYREKLEAIQVIAIAHARRRPNCCAERVRI